MARLSRLSRPARSRTHLPQARLRCPRAHPSWFAQRTVAVTESPTTIVESAPTHQRVKRRHRRGHGETAPRAVAYPSALLLSTRTASGSSPQPCPVGVAQARRGRREASHIVGGGRDRAAAFRPVGVEPLPSRPVDPLVGVGAEVVALGWETFNPAEVAREYPVRGGKVDNWLRGPMGAIVLIEVKRTGK